MGLQIADYCVLGVYFIILIVIGYIESRKIKSSSEFFMPRKFGKIMMMTFSFVPARTPTRLWASHRKVSLTAFPVYGISGFICP